MPSGYRLSALLFAIFCSNRSTGGMGLSRRVFGAWSSLNSTLCPQFAHLMVADMIKNGKKNVAKSWQSIGWMHNATITSGRQVSFGN